MRAVGTLTDKIHQVLDILGVSPLIDTGDICTLVRDINPTIRSMDMIVLCEMINSWRVARNGVRLTDEEFHQHVFNLLDELVGDNHSRCSPTVLGGILVKLDDHCRETNRMALRAICREWKTFRETPQYWDEETARSILNDILNRTMMDVRLSLTARAIIRVLAKRPGLECIRPEQLEQIVTTWYNQSK